MNTHQSHWHWMGLLLLALTTLAFSAPNSAATAHFKRGLEYSLQQNWKAAEAEYREAVRLEPRNPTYRSHLADALAAQGKFQQAQQSVQQQKQLERAAAASPRPSRPTATAPTRPANPTTPPPTQRPTPPTPTTRPTLPAQTTTRPPSDGVIIVVESTLTNDPIATAIRLYEDGKWLQAEAEYLRVLRLRPELDEGWNGLGDTYFKQKKWAEAEKAYRQAVRLRREESFYHAQLASALLKLGRADEARKEAQEAIRLGLQDHEVLDELGLTPTQR
ncbi:MAG: tetratricopeptide repeat protein [Meiothermus sp.]|nr:tetratricopeptide repeat protein [Meiothermus sp.]